jgi:hypothetical protein
VLPVITAKPDFAPEREEIAIRRVSKREFDLLVGALVVMSFSFT